MPPTARRIGSIPRFSVYLPANAVTVSVIAEYLLSAMPQCMLWQTSPTAAEFEKRIVDCAPGARSGDIDTAFENNMQAARKRLSQAVARQK